MCARAQVESIAVGGEDLEVVLRRGGLRAAPVLVIPPHAAAALDVRHRTGGGMLKPERTVAARAGVGAAQVVDPRALADAFRVKSPGARNAFEELHVGGETRGAAGAELAVTVHGTGQNHVGAGPDLHVHVVENGELEERNEIDREIVLAVGGDVAERGVAGGRLGDDRHGGGVDLQAGIGIGGLSGGVDENQPRGARQPRPRLHVRSGHVRRIRRLQEIEGRHVDRVGACREADRTGTAQAVEFRRDLLRNVDGDTLGHVLCAEDDAVAFIAATLGERIAKHGAGGDGHDRGQNYHRDQGRGPARVGASRSGFHGVIGVEKSCS